jgi:hypothetical protein
MKLSSLPKMFLDEWFIKDFKTNSNYKVFY